MEMGLMTEISNSELDLIVKIPFFKRIAENYDIDKLLSIATRGIFPEGSQIYAEGEWPTQVLIMISGTANVMVNQVMVLGQVSAGCALGEMAFIAQRPYTATLIASSPVETINFPIKRLEEIIHEDRDLGLLIHQEFTSEVITKYDKVLSQLVRFRLEHSCHQAAHDIRSPIAALKALIDSSSLMSSDARELIQGIYERIDGITTDLLQTSSLVTRKSPLEALPRYEVSLRVLIKSIQDLIEEKRIRHAHREVQVQLEHHEELKRQDSEIVFHANILKFSRILSNLIDNSYEAIVGKGLISIHLKVEAERLLIIVSDNGIGIPKDVLSVLGKTKKSHQKQNGNGLGLYHAFQLIESWDGRVQIQSQEGSGTKVTISFDLAVRTGQDLKFRG
jgi:signal transduction histidine kinase